ncbi:MAG: hypothetical protein JNG89_12660 [Planctomycetaceae bacterium]|nr:hypothetical protein [Planctomycetaceae bacterium]
MSQVFRRSLFVLLVLAARTDAAEPTWSLPDDPRAVVLQMQFADGSGTVVHTVLTVQRDGTFTDGDAAQRGTFAGRMSTDELHELLGAIIENDRVLDLTSASLLDQIESEARRTSKDWRIQNATTVVIRVGLADRTHVVECLSPDLMRTRYPAIRELDRLCAVRHRLQNVVAVSRVGGLEEARRLAALATAELRRQNGSDIQIGPRDLVQVRGTIGDLRQVQFVVEPALHPEAGESVHVCVFESPGSAPRISLTPVARPL